MNLEKFTDRAKGFLQAAQTVAIRMNHQRIAPRASAQGAARGRAGHGLGPDRRAPAAAPKRALREIDEALAKIPAVSGSGAQQTPGARRRDACACSTRPSRSPQKAGDSYVTVERLLLALALATHHRRGQGARQGRGVKPEALNAAINELRGGRTADTAGRRGPLRRAQEIRPRPHPGGARRQARPGDRPRRGDPPHHPDPRPPHQEQSGADRRARRRQDRDRRGPRAAHRQWRRARQPQGPAADGARHGLADRRRQISRRVRGAAQGRARRGQGAPRARSSCSSTRCTR